MKAPFGAVVKAVGGLGSTPARRCPRAGAGGTIARMASHRDFLALDDRALLSQCAVDTYKASGPGGQHRNKVSSAVRLRHGPTDLSAHGDDSRSQHENKRLALRRLRVAIATTLRHPVDTAADGLPEVVEECLHRDKVRPGASRRRLTVGRRDERYWRVVAALLDVLEALEGRVSDAAAWVGISTSNLIKVLRADQRALTAVQDIRRRHGEKPLK